MLAKVARDVWSILGALFAVSGLLARLSSETDIEKLESSMMLFTGLILIAISGCTWVSEND